MSCPVTVCDTSAQPTLQTDICTEWLYKCNWSHIGIHLLVCWHYGCIVSSGPVAAVCPCAMQSFLWLAKANLSVFVTDMCRPLKQIFHPLHLESLWDILESHRGLTTQDLSAMFWNCFCQALILDNNLYDHSSHH